MIVSNIEIVMIGYENKKEAERLLDGLSFKEQIKIVHNLLNQISAHQIEKKELLEKFKSMGKFINKTQCHLCETEYRGHGEHSCEEGALCRSMAPSIQSPRK